MNAPLFAPLLAIYPILHIASSNPGQASARTVVVAVVAALLASVLLLVLIRPIVRSWNQAALGVAVVVVLFFAYGPVHTSLESTLLDALTGTSWSARQLQKIAPWLHPLLSTIWIVLLALGLRAVLKLPADRVPAIIRGANATAMVLLGLVAIESRSQWNAAASEATHIARAPADGLATSVLGYNPDIYTIVLDGYAREDVLRQHYGFDNSEFLDGLRTRGFDVRAASNANYNWTFLSLASSLNMDYLQRLLGNRISPSIKSRAAVYDLVRRNAVSAFLQERGYTIVHLQTTWGATLQNPYADVQIPCHRSLFGNEFHRVVAEASWLKTLQSRISADLAECYLSNLSVLAQMGSRPGPKFVFAHFVPPHHPYLFDRKGRVLRSANLSNQFEFQKRLWEDKRPYVDQMIYMNHRVTSVIDRILADSPRPPIIVLQSDHGPNLDAGLSRQEKVRIRLANFAAALLPGAPAGLIPSEESSVNEFRRILNHYFGARLDILPDRYYFSGYDDPFRFYQVDVRRPAESSN